MKRKDMKSLGDVYGAMLNSVKVVKESTGPGAKSLEEDDAAELQNGGPDEKGGFRKAVNDEDEESEDIEDESETEKPKKKKVVKESRKNSKRKVNNSMQSNFDKLISRVLKENFGSFGQEDAEDEIDALGLGDATPDSDLGDDFGGDDDFGGEGDDITLTIDRATAQTLIDLLQGALGGGEEDFGDEGEIEDEGDLSFDETEVDEDNEEEEDMNFEEDEETYGTKTNAPDKKKVFQAKNNKVGGKVKPHNKKASSEVTDDVGDDGDFGHAITSPKKVNDGKQNKVGNLTKGQDFFR